MEKYNRIEKIKEIYKNLIKKDTEINTNDNVLIISENKIDYYLLIEKIQNTFTESWLIDSGADAAGVVYHRLLQPAMSEFSKDGDLITEKYYLNDIEYSKKEFYNHPLNKELIIARRFKL